MDFLTLAGKRFSVRAFSDRRVEAEKLEKIFEAARLAPTARNYQPQRVFAVQNEEKLRRLAEVCSCTYSSPLVFVVGYEPERSAKGMITEGFDFGESDAAIVCTHMMLEAVELGLGSCWVGWFSEKAVAEALGIPESIRIRALLPVGYPAENAKPSPKHSESRCAEEMFEII